MKFIKTSLAILVLLVVLVGCTNNYTPSNNEEFDKTVEDYFIADLTDDYDKIKKLLPESEIKKDSNLMEKKGGEVLNPDYKEIMGERYEIKGFDYFVEEHNQILYLVDYFDPVTENPHRLAIYGVEETDNGFLIMNRNGTKVGSSQLGTHFKEETGNRLINTSALKELMEKHPENVYKVHEYEK